MSDKYPGGFVTTGAPAGFSVAFDGSGDYLTYAPNAGVAFGTGDFTIELFIYPTASISQVYLMDARNSGQTSSWAIGFNLNNTGAGQFTFFNGVAGAAYNESSQSCVLNQWNHCVAVRSGTTFSLFTNGTRVYTTTNSTNYSVSQTTSYIARGYSVGSELYYTGYMSNIRIVKGTAVYDPAQTTLRVPTQLLNITNTSLLTCQSPTIIDNSTNNFTITANGDAKVSNFTPFAGYQGFNPALGAAAGGVWTLDEAAYYQGNRQWPIYDPYFKNTTLMLHGNGTNGAQNNTFLDSSTNNFTITRNGNTTQGTFTPFSQTGWSNYFNGSSGIRFPDSSSLQFGTSAFTVEGWFNVPSAPANDSSVISKWVAANDANSSWMIDFQSSNISAAVSIGGTVTRITSTSGINLNTWTHVALVRSGSPGTLSLFLNGIRVATSSLTGSLVDDTNPVGIGVRGGTDGYYLTGYVSNIRVINGIDLYGATNTAFTVPTQPLTAVNNTTLLTCQSQRFVDNSALNATATALSAPSVQAFSPFVPTVTTPTTYSNKFDGSSYMYTASSAAFNLGLYTSWTMEGFVYMPSIGGGNFNSFFVFNSGSDHVLIGFLNTSTNVYLQINGTAYQSSTPLNIGQWNHVAAVRNAGSTVALYLNGVQLLTAANLPVNSNKITYIGGNGSSNYYGNISNLRIVTGTALYTGSTYTVPTAALTAISGTQLLTCQNSTISDSSSNAFTFTISGTIPVVASPVPFPAKVDQTTLNTAYSTSLVGGSGYFDGTGDYLVTPSNAAFTFGTGDFTAEAWVYPTSLSASNKVIFDFRAANDTSGYQIGLYSTTTPYVANSIGGILNGTATMAPNAWMHVAVTRESGTLRIFINGVQAGSVSNSLNCTNTICNIGGNYSGGEAFPGYIANARVIKGTAVYTSAFTPPTSLLTTISGTSLLLNYTNAGIIDNTAKIMFETVGTAQISTTQSKWGNSSISFPNSLSSYLKTPTNTLLDFGTGDFTIELWVYFNSVATEQGFFGGSTTNAWELRYRTGGTGLSLGRLNTAFDSVFPWTPVANTWYHVAVTRSNSIVRGFINGTQIGTNSTNTNTYNSGTLFYMGLTDTANSPMNGYIDDARITKGYARYTANFTPPTSQLQDQ